MLLEFAIDMAPKDWNNVSRREALEAFAAAAPHGQNSTTNTSDNVFSDGIDHEMATLAGDTTSGYTASLTIGVAV